MRPWSPRWVTSHFTIGEPGWEEIADYALTWAVNNARTAPAASAV